ncbi:TnsA endonuclease N-terminal domain-containing protein [Burkholderia pseudomallei]|uniref:TnsA endonuclease N-terminal domain-containing protein n=1 Tax=Burkholderia pseudomallei TaxID=28450 RepID=UPI00052AC5F0|nr:TnsA endonuclease N-terminal domain-containing protein [Burkholderia pseudomallei]AIV82035.1 hypothetical protein X978_5490 [Burkholderia pseudomallei MSHR3965]KGV97047.1 hypothetical protein X897_5579 [Burkholderia pseudomallei ABCPW 30]KGW07404.1 hypothetical protein X980_4372 [Burkholderia pseudomallei MSHR4000]ONC61699.1 hypothetical protein AQ917_25655 [Burkholderia pseudomallei]
MLSNAQLVDLFDHLGTPPAGRKLVQEARVHAPVRKVASRGGNVITYVASRKMAREIATESYGIEFAAAIGFEYDERVLEFYPKPCKLQLSLVDGATGEIRAIHHTPDFLAICQDGITLEEWKSETKLNHLAEKYPYRYAPSTRSSWCTSVRIADALTRGTSRPTSSPAGARTAGLFSAMESRLRRLLRRSSGRRLRSGRCLKLTRHSKRRLSGRGCLTQYKRLLPRSTTEREQFLPGVWA